MSAPRYVVGLPDWERNYPVFDTWKNEIVAFRETYVDAVATRNRLNAGK